MAVFYILLLAPLAIQHFEFKRNKINFKNKNETSLLFFFVFLTALVMFRHESVGSDTTIYMYIFSRHSSLPWGGLFGESAEFGFVFYNKIISLFTKNNQAYFAITAILTSAMIYPTYKRLCVDSALTIVLYTTMSTFVMAFSGIRQMLAIGIGVLAYECTRNKKIIPFVLLVLLAMSFHTSAFMLAFMYPLYHAKITKRWLFAVIPTLAVVFVFNQQIFLMLALVLERYTKYDASIVQTGAYTMLILFGLFAIFSFLIPKDSALDQETIGLRNFLLFSVALQMFAPLHTIAMRMNYYYIIFIPLLIPKIIEARGDRWKQVAVVGRNIMVVFFLLYFFYNAYVATNNLHVFPYHFFWETV